MIIDDDYDDYGNRRSRNVFGDDEGCWYQLKSKSNGVELKQQQQLL